MARGGVEVGPEVEALMVEARDRLVQAVEDAERTRDWPELLIRVAVILALLDRGVAKLGTS